MDWTEQFDGYCERTDLSYWSEPINAVTNLAFILAAVVMWRRSRGLPIARALSAILGLIGAGSYLFHTHATAWAAALDVLPIVIFGLVYLYAANRVYLGWPGWAAFVAMLGFLPFAAGVGLAASEVPFLAISSVYWAYPILFFAYAGVLHTRAPATARGLAIAGCLLTASIILRSLDTPLCDRLPIGTHFWWHILNGVVLGWVIEVYRRHMVAGEAAGR